MGECLASWNMDKTTLVRPVEMGDLKAQNVCYEDK